MKKSTYMIMDYPNLVKYFASKNPIHLLLFICPIWLFIFSKLSASSMEPLTLMVGLLTGVLYWTFLEYIIHRFAYHSFYKSKFIRYFLGSFHLHHHEDMSDHRILNAGFIMIYVLAPTVLLPFWITIQSIVFLYSMALGLTLAYYFYECVHYLLHYKYYSAGYLGYIQKYHMFHHNIVPSKNFGNTSHLWDVLLGTYDKGYVDYKISDKTKSTLIKSKTEGKYVETNS